MSAARMLHRRAWKSDHPAQFNRRNKQIVAAGFVFDGQLRPRMSFTKWRKTSNWRPSRSDGTEQHK